MQMNKLKSIVHYGATKSQRTYHKDQKPKVYSS